MGTFSRRTLGLAGGYGLFFLVVLWAAYTNQLPLDWLAQFPNYDKVGHLVLYCIPSYLGHRLFRHKHFNGWGRSLPFFPSLFFLFTITEELIQGLSPYRTLDAGDMACSIVGIGAGYWLARARR